MDTIREERQSSRPASKDSPGAHSSALRKTAVAAALAAVVGLLVGIEVAVSALGSGYWVFAIAAPLAAALTFGGLWWGFAARRDEVSVLRAVFLGASAGIFSHPLCWYLLFLGAWSCYVTTGSCTSSLGSPPIGPIDGLWGIWATSFFSLLFWGWVTVPAGIIIALWSRRRVAAPGLSADHSR